MFKIASWNVNSLKVRLQHVLDWLESEQPDVLALQETKSQDENFPLSAITESGYQVAFAGQKTYNGVAVLSKTPITDVMTDFPTLNDDPQRRILGATIESQGATWRVLDLYVPNGSEVGSEKYAYKLDWLEHLYLYAQEFRHQYDNVVILGDFNIAPDDRDVHDPEKWRDKILVSEPERAALQKLLDLGFVDTFRLFEQEEKLFSWWDYRAAGFRRNHGLRIDLILASQNPAAACEASWIDIEPRRLEKPSDHAPVVASFKSLS